MEKENKNGIIILIVVLSLLIIGLGGFIVYDKLIVNNNTEEKADDHSDDNQNNHDNNEITKDIFELLLEGDFSGIAGDYINSEGEIVTLLANGNVAFENGIGILRGSPKINDIEEEQGTYQWGFSFSDNELSGGRTVLYPIGIKVYDGYDYLDDDTSKIRLTFGNGFPTANEIYYKK